MFPSLAQLSHATIVVGNREKNLEAFKTFLAHEEVAVQANPDISIFNDEQITIEDARMITSMLSSQKVNAARFCIISCDRLAIDVQNVLLKTLEEPQPGTYIILIIPNRDSLISTVLSRCQIIVGDSGVGESRLIADDFLKKTTAERFAFVESWTKNKKDEDNVSKTEVIYFIDDLEKKLWSIGNRDEQLFTDIRRVRQYAGIRGGSHRILLDFLGMICPQVK